MIDQVLSHTSDRARLVQGEPREPRQPQGRLVRLGRRASRTARRPTTGCRSSAASPGNGNRAAASTTCTTSSSSQPDLNFHNPAVRGATLDNVEFWLDTRRRRPAPGCDQLLLPRRAAARQPAQAGGTAHRPRLQRRQSVRVPVPLATTTRSRRTWRSSRTLRALLDRYPAAAALGEISSEDSLATMAEYTSNDRRLHMGYSFELLTDDFSTAHIREHRRERWKRRCQDGWPCWAISNHDVAARRVALGRRHEADAIARQAVQALVCSLRGSVCLYQGEELGLTEAERAVRGRCRIPTASRSGRTSRAATAAARRCRGTTDEQAGFTHGQPWLPIPPEHHALVSRTCRKRRRTPC